MFRTSALHSVGGQYINVDIATSTPGTVLDAVDRNITQEELCNAVLSSGQALDSTGADDEQIARALAIVGAGASACVDTGAKNAHEIAPVLPDIVAPASYAQMDGFLVFFAVVADNDDAATCDYNGLGAKPITDRAGDALAGGELSATVFLVYNADDERWELLFSTTSAADGVQSITGQSGVVTIGGTASIPHISIANGGINADRLASASVTLPKLSNSATASLNVAKRTIKAWVSYNGDTQTINEAFNVSSVVRTGNGEFTVNLSPPMADNKYLVLTSGCQHLDDAGGASDAVNAHSKTTSSFKVTCWNAGSSKGDLAIIDLAVLGN